MVQMRRVCGSRIDARSESSEKQSGSGYIQKLLQHDLLIMGYEKKKKES